MKTVRLSENIVVEIIPNYALPVEKWYGTAFASLCVEAPDEVAVNWEYKNGEWVEPSDDPTDPTPTAYDILEAQVTYTAMMTDTLLEV